MSDELAKVQVALHCGERYETIREADAYARSMLDILHNGNESALELLCEENIPVGQDIAAQEAVEYLRAIDMEEKKLRLDLLYLTLTVRQAHGMIGREVRGDYTQAIGSAIQLKQQILGMLSQRGYSV